MKFTEVGFIKVSIAYDWINSMFIMHVLDTGRGIGKQDLDKLFKRFGKLKQEDSGVNKEGIGLGLAICQAIVAHYQGQIEVLSHGHALGALFIVSMKMEAVPEESQLLQEE